MPQNESEMNKRRMVRLSNEAAGQLTRECLQTALIRLLAEQEMDKISITELVRVAGVSRTAFYSNYNSKEEVLLDWVSSYLSELQSMMVGAVRTHNLQGGFEQIFEHILSGEKEFALLHFFTLVECFVFEECHEFAEKRYIVLLYECENLVDKKKNKRDRNNIAYHAYPYCLPKFHIKQSRGDNTASEFDNWEH